MKLQKSIIILFTALIMACLAFAVMSEDITADDVRSAAKIFGLEMTQSEIDSLLPDLGEAREDYQANRERQLENADRPALVFNPLPPAYQIDTLVRPVVYSSPGEVKLPENREELAFFTVLELAELIRSKQISSTELTQFFIDRLRKYDPLLHCVITLTEERALEQARLADAEIAAGRYRGPLHGIPYGAKDLLATSEYRTTWGAMPFREQVFDYDATVIKKLEEAGAVLVAKLTLGALAWGDVWYGERTRNPWDPERGSSGSSAGSASAVAAGLVPFAIGTETLGSIVSPSTVCGTTGLRPTFGRVSRHGAMALVWSMDKIGPIARSAEDCAAVFEAIYGPDGLDPSIIDAPFNYDHRLDPAILRVGYLKSAFERDYGFKQQDSLTLATLRNLGIELIPVELPDMPDLGVILSAEAAAAFDELTRSGMDDLMVRQIRNSWPNVFRAARFIPAVEYIQANRLRSRLIQQMAEVFQQVDVYVHPSWASSSLAITNYTGHPCVVLPNGFR
ncbi:MAG: amidase, partial [Saprospiraceae bacterium]|nr:amidase [Saprospiraceae bacterium]